MYMGENYHDGKYAQTASLFLSFHGVKMCHQRAEKITQLKRSLMKATQLLFLLQV